MRRLVASRIGRVALATSIALTLLPPSLAFAAPAPSGKISEDARGVVVIDLSQDEKENAELLLDVRQATADHVDKRGDFDFKLTDLNQPLNAGGESKDRTNIATAQGFAQAGKASADKKEWADASDQYESARKLYEESLAVIDDPAIYGPLVVREGEALLLGGDDKAARDMFLQGAFWEAKVDGLDPKARAAYDKAKSDVAGLDKGIIEVNTDPAYGEVFIDGKYRGISPVRVIDIPVGTHIVTVSKPAHERGTARVDVKSGATAHKDVKLNPARRKLIYDGLKPKLEQEIVAATTPGSKKWGLGGDNLVELGTLTRSESVLLAKVTGPPETKTLELWVFHVPSQRLVAVSQTDNIDWSFRNTDAIKTIVHKTLDIDWVTKLGGEVEGPPSKGGGVTSKWWFWTLIGVAVAGGTAAIVLATAPGESPPPFDKVDGTGAVVLKF
ncbi:MAG: PEGA domain-containing protein [Myxococcota bacterium]